MTRFSSALSSVIVLASILAVPLDAQAPAAPPTRHAVTYVDVAPSSKNAMVSAFKRYRDASRAESGFQQAELFEQAGRPANFIIIETWADQSAYDAHAMAAHTKQYREAVDAIRLGGYDQRPYRTLSVAPPAAGNNQAVYVIAHVDIGGQQPDVPGMLSRYAEASRKERGAVRVDVLQHVMRANHFTVVEAWANQGAFEAHAAAAHTKQYREALTPITGSPVDERVLQAVP
jgi:quinol monooxygenase YgiN